MKDELRGAPSNPHHLSRRQVVLIFGGMVVAVVLGYVIIDRALQREQRKRAEPMWDGGAGRRK